MSEFNFPEELKKLPQTPGVYLMYDSHNTVIYVGKAVNLKRRVSSYFRESTKHSNKIKSMISKISRFEYILTDSELEALILECNLIKEYRPRYNTMLMDDKAYPYICVTITEDYPRIIFARSMKKDGNKYYGPFTSGSAVRDTIELLRKLYHLRSCNKALRKDLLSKNVRPCLYYHIGQCSGVCQGSVSTTEYAKRIDQAIKFLEGDYKTVLKDLKSKMTAASEKMDFEQALECRELINSIEHVAGNQKITTSQFEDRDIIAYAKQGADAVVQIFFVRNGKLIGRDHFYVTIDEADTGEEILTSFIKQYYIGTPFIPHELLVREEIKEAQLLGKMLSRNRNSKVRIIRPQRGQKNKLMELATKNAKILLEQNKEKYQREQRRTIGAVHELETLMGISGIFRMESYDISHTGGYETVGSMIVYEEGKPKKNKYRKFRLKGAYGNDDYANMEEVLTRRFTHGLQERKKLDEEGKDYTFGSFSQFPDVLMMDGGKGQVNVALEVLRRLGLNIPVCGMVKDDKHRTRGLYYNNIEIPIDARSEGFRFITRMQDETHRFAIEYHRKLRNKKEVHSVLDEIDGIGPARRKALMKEFRSIERIKNATPEELEKVPQITKKAAKSIYDYFHG